MLSPEEAFPQKIWRRIERKFVPEPNSGCWLWFGATVESGYGRYWFEGNIRPIHRLVYERCHQCDLPSDVFVCHRCDTPPCLNPEHLFQGRQVDNLADCIAKGRMPRGERAGRSKLTDSQVSAIIADLRPYRLIAREYGIHVEHVGALRRGVRRDPEKQFRRKARESVQ